MAQFHRITQTKTNFQIDSAKAMKKLLAKSKQRKQMIILLLNQQRFYEHQNHKALQLNKTPQEYKLSETKHKFGDRIKTTKIIRGASLTPKFKKHMQSLSKLPPLKPNEEKEIRRKDEKLSPWQYKESKDLLRPVSSRCLPY